VELASPYFKSGKAAEVYRLVVMKDYHDGSWSFAIDEFPEMEEKALEEFYIQKVEDHRARREETFRRIRRASSVCSSRGLQVMPQVGKL